MFTIGLTGSIGMGKSTTAEIFRSLGAPVYDSDKAVHDLYDSEAVPEVGDLFPSCLRDGKIDRAKLAERVLSDPQALKRLEAIIHPLVQARKTSFLQAQAARGARLVVLDVPLLFETSGDRNVDLVLVVSAPTSVQKARVLARPGMTAEKFDAIIAKQMSDAEKRRRAHVVVDTGRGLSAAREQIQEIMRAVSGRR